MIRWRRLHWSWLLLLAALIGYGLGVSTWTWLRGMPDSPNSPRAFQGELQAFPQIWHIAQAYRAQGQLAALDDATVHPFLPLFMVPWTFLPLPLANAVFVFLGVLAAGFALVLAETLLADGLKDRPRRAFIVAVVVLLPALHLAALSAALAPLVLLLLLANWLLFERGGEWLAGAALGMAALLYLPLVLIVVPFLLKRRWRVAVGALGAYAVLGVLLPMGSLGFSAALAALAEYLAGALQAYSTPAAADTGGLCSLSVALRGLVSAEDATTPPEVAWRSVGGIAVLGLLMAVALALFAVSALAASQPPRGRPQDVAEGQAFRAQFGAWCCLPLVLTTILWPHQLVLAAWPVAFVADRWERSLGTAAGLCAGVLGVWLATSLLAFWPAAQALALPWLGVVIVWGGQIWLSRHLLSSH